MTTDIPGWKQRAEDFLGPYADPESESLHEEAVIYFLSRGQDCEEAIDQIIKNWGVRIKQEGELYKSRGIPIFPFTIWRMVESGQIGQYKRYWDKTPDLSSINIYDIQFLCSKFDFVNSFFLFWSDTGIKRFHKKLDAVLTNFREFSEDNPLYLRTAQYSGAKPYNPPLLQRGFMQAATYLFGRYRLQSDIGNDEVAQSAIEFLLRNQASDWSWWKDNTSSGNIILTSAALHALVLTEPFGAKRHIERAKDFLIKMQDSDGSWAKTERYDAVYSTVFVLDALQLADGGKQVTFTLPENKEILKENMPRLNEQKNVIFEIKAPVYMQKSKEDNENIPVKDLTLEDIKEAIKHAEHKLLKDKINLAIYKEYFIFERQKEKNPNTKIISMDKLTKTLKENGIIPEDYTSEAIRKRLKKLIAENLISDIFAEKRRQAREKTMDDQFWGNK